MFEVSFERSHWKDIKRKKVFERHQALQRTTASWELKTNQKHSGALVGQFVPQRSQDQGARAHTHTADKTTQRVIYMLTMFALIHMSEQKVGTGTYWQPSSVTNNSGLSSKS